ncbi:tripartite tricarboxylate transporter TctB family protein [Salicibibacter cibi]|uniref:Tripartite tricarboxylate transporter TctB family protein n=1 Tax=Salicibibacter cibi TaxID=2743001 RepID=A0A7T7CFN6_9BACI|nr:tripartite tricarboxylate transporter TctB family protein [Salicibibacter cibi]QQK80284.1 tripartite tricarboxylate transporter TctB family protein [Salicibibacter cibi]
MSRKVENSLPPMIFLILGILLLTTWIPQQIPITGNEAINARFFPYILSLALIICSAFTLIISLKEKKSKSYDVEKESKQQSNKYYRIILVIFISVFWLITIQFLGFISTTIILVASTMLVFGNRVWYQIIPVSIIFPILSYLLFSEFLNVRFPDGMLF